MADEKLKRNLESVNWFDLLQKGELNKADGILTQFKQSYDKQIEKEEELQTWESVFVVIHWQQLKILGVYKSLSAAADAMKEHREKSNLTNDVLAIQRAFLYDF